MKFCNAPNCKYPVFGKGFCRSHQYMREDYDRRSIVQRAMDKEKNNPLPKRESKIRRPGTFVMPVNEKIPVKSTVTSFKPSREQVREANDVIVPLKPFEGKGEQGKWFMDRKAEMTGICQHCSGKTMIALKDEVEAAARFHYSVCHILPKSLFPSVATNVNNWIELCYYTPSCHAQYDNGQLAVTDMNCFGVIIDRLVKMYPAIATEERKRIPPVLMEYIKQDL